MQPIRTQLIRLQARFNTAMRRLLGMSLAILGWFMLGAQTRREVTPGQISLDMFRFDHVKQGTQVNREPVYWLAGGVAAAVGLSFVAYYQYKKFKQQNAIKKVNSEKAALHLDVLTSRLGLEVQHKMTLEEICNSRDPNELIPVVEDPEKFEALAAEYKKKVPDKKQWKKIYSLRHKLGYDFHNRRAPFNNSQMLTAGLKLECAIPHRTKKIMFMSPILDASETSFVIKPPTVKGKAVNLKRYKYLICSIRRDDEAEYEFSVPIINQLTGNFNAIVLGHTRDIRKMFIREFERVELAIAANFCMIEESIMEDDENQAPMPVRLDSPLDSFDGTIIDLSLGGLKVHFTDPPAGADVGNLLVFRLPQANVREDLMARILRINPSKNGVDYHLQFFRLRELARMKLNKMLHNVKKESEAQSTEGKTPATKATDDKAAPQARPSNQPANQAANQPVRAPQSAPAGSRVGAAAQQAKQPQPSNNTSTPKAKPQATPELPKIDEGDEVHSARQATSANNKQSPQPQSSPKDAGSQVKPSPNAPDVRANVGRRRVGQHAYTAMHAAENRDAE